LKQIDENVVSFVNDTALEIQNNSTEQFPAGTVLVRLLVVYSCYQACVVVIFYHIFYPAKSVPRYWQIPARWATQEEVHIWSMDRKDSQVY